MATPPSTYAAGKCGSRSNEASQGEQKRYVDAGTGVANAATALPRMPPSCRPAGALISLASGVQGPAGAYECTQVPNLSRVLVPPFSICCVSRHPPFYTGRASSGWSFDVGGPAPARDRPYTYLVQHPFSSEASQRIAAALRPIPTGSMLESWLQERIDVSETERPDACPRRHNAQT